MIDLDIITVTWNSEKTIAKQIESVLQAVEGLKYNFFVVDNDSQDKTIEIVKKYPQVQLIINDKNLGFGGAHNKIISKLSGQFLLLINPDMKLNADSVKPILDIMKKQKNIGLLSVKLTDEKGEFNVNAGPRRFPGLFDQLVILFKLHHIWPKLLNKYLMADFNYNQQQEVDSVRGSFMLLRKEIYKSLGWIFDPRYFIWFEDVDLCREVYRLGYKVVYTPVSTVIDFVGQSFKQRTNLWKQKNFTKSMFLYFRKWEPWYKWLVIGIVRYWSIFLVWLKVKLFK